MKLLYLTAATILLASGCASTAGNLSDAASRLDRSADALYDEVREDSGNASLERDAEKFSDIAGDFHRDVRERMAADDLRDRFDIVAGRYHELRDEFTEARPSTRERTVFNDVTRAYLDLERELQYSGDRSDRYRSRRDRD
jgi:hypothetical protein